LLLRKYTAQAYKLKMTGVKPADSEKNQVAAKQMISIESHSRVQTGNNPAGKLRANDETIRQPVQDLLVIKNHRRE